MKKLTTTPFDVANYLQTHEEQALYLSTVLESGTKEEFLIALNDVARARGMSEVAKEANLNRESLYKSLNPKAKPQFETISKVINALGFHIQITPNVAAS